LSTNIQWTDETWNPASGCDKVSPGCANCYIERTPPFRINGRRFDRGHIPLQLHANRLEAPLHWGKPRRVFVNSLSDLFHDDIPDEFIDKVFAVMALAQRHTFQILTKRAARMRDYMVALDRDLRIHTTTFPRWRSDAEVLLNARKDSKTIVTSEWPLPNVELGVSVENQHFADERIPLLLQVPAAVRFISAEPLLGPVDIERYMWPMHWHWASGYNSPAEAIAAGAYAEKKPQSLVSAHARFLDWVIVGVEKLAGGRAGRNATAYEEHARSLLQQCAAAEVAAFHKQMPVGRKVSGEPAEWPPHMRVRQFPAASVIRLTGGSA
jgi:protein gp37